MRKALSLLLILAAMSIRSSCSGGEEADKKNDEIRQIYETVCTADEALALAKSSPVVVFEFSGCTSGKEVWNEFYAQVRAGRPASVLCANYYTLEHENISEALYEQERDQYPQLYFCLLTYDGKAFSTDIRLSSSAADASHEEYSCLCHYTGDAPTPDALYEHYEYYVLTDDPDVTWDEIERSMLDSSDPSMIRHCMVYDDYTGWKG